MRPSRLFPRSAPTASHAALPPAASPRCVRARAGQVWDVDKGEEMLTSGALGCAATAVHFSPDGARIAFGCNIGAYFGGIASTSLHGWLWFVAAFLWSSVGTKLRPSFGL